MQEGSSTSRSGGIIITIMQSQAQGEAAAVIAASTAQLQEATSGGCPYRESSDTIPVQHTIDICNHVLSCF
jgi:hypothetical protein